MLFLVLRFCVLFCLFALVCMSMQHSGPAPWGSILGLCPPKSLLVPPKTRIVPPKRGLCTKESHRLVPLVCSSRPETPKILVITPEFVGKNHSFADFAVKTFVFCFHPRICEISHMLRNENLCFLVFTPDKVFVLSLQNCLCPLQGCRSLLSIGGDNLQFYPNFAVFSTLGG